MLKFLTKLRVKLRILWNRYIPSIVFRGDEVEVGIHFKQAEIDLDDLSKIEELLLKNNIHFDKGAGFGERDWEWDYSLQGPVSVRFKRVKSRRNIRRCCSSCTNG